MTIEPTKQTERSWWGRAVALLCGLLFVAGVPGVDDVETAVKKATKSAARQQDAKAALASFNSLIGGWRGVGMPKRGSARGAWTETAEWVWDFKKDRVAILYKINRGKLLSSAALTYDAATKSYRMHATFTDKTERDYRGRWNGKKLVLEAKPDKSGIVYRMTLTRLNEKRTLVLHEKRRSRQSFFTRIAEVGYTRQGTSLAEAGSGEPECIVTGGKGTIKVSYQGKSYFVCCSGCKQAFQDDPQGIIAEYKMKLAEQRQKKAGKTSPQHMF